MKRGALVALMLAILLPVTGYFIVKYYSKDAVIMPRHYFYDSVAVSKKGGKTINDTLWHRVKNISFQNQLGDNVSLDDLRGKIVVVNFFFTRCPTICPGLTKAMKKLQDSFKKNPDIVHFLSISVDPENDSVAALRKFADRFNINHDNWWFVTGNKQHIYDFAIKEMKASIADTQVDTAFIHTEKFFLMDTNRIIRGFYEGFDSVKQKQLVADIPTLRLEKDKEKPSVLRGFIPHLPYIFLGILMVIILVTLLSRKKSY